jgi:hypothetical protein
MSEFGMVICNSRNGSLLEVTSGDTIWQFDQDQVMSRGLAVTDEYIFVGISQFGNRLERYWKTGGICVIDRKTFKMIDMVEIPGSGDIQEIRIIGEKDYCHNDQIISPGIVKNLEVVSPFLSFAYNLRKKYPSLQKNIYPVSVLVKAINVFERHRMARGNIKIA